MAFRHRSRWSPKRPKDIRQQVLQGRYRIDLLKKRWAAHRFWVEVEHRTEACWLESRGFRGFLWGLVYRYAARRLDVIGREIYALDRGLGQFGAAWQAHLRDKLEGLEQKQGFLARLRARAALVQLNRLRRLEADLGLVRYQQAFKDDRADVWERLERRSLKGPKAFGLGRRGRGRGWT